MIHLLPDELLAQVISKSNNPSIFSTSRNFGKVASEVVQLLAPTLDEIQDANMAAYVCGATPTVETVMALHPAVRGHRGIAKLMISRTGGFDYENFSLELASNVDIADAALQASEGYIFGLMPPALQNDPDVILTGAQAFQIDTESSTIQDLAEAIQGIVLNAWEDFEDIRASFQ